MKHIVCINAGHGGKDPGALGNNLKEKDINLSVSLKVGEILKRHGIKIIYTRTTDVFVGLTESANIANRANADIFASIHCNSVDNLGAQGVEVYAYPNSKDGKELSQSILDSIISHKLYTKNRGIKTNNFAVLRETKMTATLAELGFISNAEDADILKNKQDELAVAVAKGILKYLGIDYKETAQTNTLDVQYQQAVKELAGVNIISSLGSWENLEKVHVNNVKSLVIKMAAYITQGI